MKKKYVAPSTVLVELSSQSIIATSLAIKSGTDSATMGVRRGEWDDEEVDW